MSDLSAADDFERELRTLCDLAFERPPASDNPLRLVMDGQLPKEKLTEFWASRWPEELILNQIILPHSLEMCSDTNSRVELWSIIYSDYGRGAFVSSTPVLYRNVLHGLGLPPQKFSMSLEEQTPQIKARIAACNSLGWIDTLVELLAFELPKPKLFGLFAHALRKHYAVREDDLVYFNQHLELGKLACEVLFALLARHCATDEDRAHCKRTLARVFDEHPNREFFCALLGSQPYSFLKPPPDILHLDRRRVLRFKIDPSAQVAGERQVLIQEKGETREAVTWSLTGTGALLSSKKLSPPGTRFVVTLIDAASQKTLEIPAKVINLAYDNEGNAVGMGIKFDSEEYLRRHIQDFTSQSPASASAPVHTWR